MNKRLYRSRRDKMIGGVAAGLANYFEIDPTLVRVLFIVTLFLGGSGIIAYIVLWIVVPEEPYVTAHNSSAPPPEGETTTNFTIEQEHESFEKHKNKRTNMAGIILVVIGFLFLADNFFPRIRFGDFWPLILIAVGIGLLLNSRQHSGEVK